MAKEKGMIRDFLYRYVARYKGMVFLSLCLMLVVAISRMAPAYILKVAIDRYISRGDFYGLSLMALLYLFFILSGICGHLSADICLPALRPERHTRHEDSRRSTISSGLPVPYFDKTPHGKNLQYVTSDMENVNEFITSGIVTTAGDVITIAGILAVMFYLSMPSDGGGRLFFSVFSFPSWTSSETLPSGLREIETECGRDERLFGREPLRHLRVQGIRSGGRGNRQV